MLQRNLQSLRNQRRVVPIELAVGESEGISDFTFLPELPAESTRHASEQRERRLLIQRDSEDFTETISCKVETLQNILDRELTCDSSSSSVSSSSSLPIIDYLKIDAEGDELNVLTGLGFFWFSRIRQIAVEVYDADNRLEKVTRLLMDNSFNVNVTQQVSK